MRSGDLFFCFPVCLHKYSFSLLLNFPLWLWSPLAPHREQSFHARPRAALNFVSACFVFMLAVSSHWSLQETKDEVPNNFQADGGVPGPSSPESTTDRNFENAISLLNLEQTKSGRSDWTIIAVSERKTFTRVLPGDYRVRVGETVGLSTC